MKLPTIYAILSYTMDSGHRSVQTSFLSVRYQYEIPLFSFETGNDALVNVTQYCILMIVTLFLYRDMADESAIVLNPGESIQPKLGEQEARHLVRRLYGMSAIKVVELNSYDDKNFHILVDTATSGDVKWSEDGYVLKILNSLDSKFPEAIGTSYSFINIF
jgi:hypothetical protein